MTLPHAEELVRQLQNLIADDSTRGTRRNPHLLPASKSQLMSAIKLLVAQLYYIAADDALRLEPLMRAAMALDSFDDRPLDAVEFIAAMQKRRHALEEFRETLRAVRRDQPFFWQQVYPLAGVETRTKSNTVFAGLRDRFTSHFKKPQPATPNAPRTYDYASGRYDLD